MNQAKFDAMCARLFSLDTEYQGVKRTDSWDHHEWTVTINLKRTRKSFRTTYRQGMAHHNAPTIGEVVAALLSDSRCAEPSTFEAFCDEFGYDHDSRRAEATYRACKETSEVMHRLLGDRFAEYADAAAGL